MAYIQYDPHEPGGRGKALLNFYFGMFVLWGSIGSIIYYIGAIATWFEGTHSTDILYALGFLVLMSVVDFFAITAIAKGESKIEFAKIYFLFFIGGVLDLSGIIGIIVSIRSLEYNAERTSLLVGSILCCIIVSLAVLLIYRKIEGYGPIKLFAGEKVLSEVMGAAPTQSASAQSTVPHSSSPHEELTAVDQSTFTSGFFFCHKCGKKLPNDSIFCSTCGMKLR